MTMIFLKGGRTEKKDPYCHEEKQLLSQQYKNVMLILVVQAEVYCQYVLLSNCCNSNTKTQSSFLVVQIEVYCQ